MSDDDVVAAEAALGIRLPEDYIAFVRGQERLTNSFGEEYLDFLTLAEVVERNADEEPWNDLRNTHAGILIIGTNGAGERLVYDTRKAPYPVLLVDSVSSGWHEACWQADSLDVLLAQLLDGGTLRFERGYGS